jgi:hypothetical protein
MIPMPVRAADSGSSSGQFQVGNAAPTVTSVELWTTGGAPATTNDLTPLVEYNIKVDVSDGNTLDDLSTLTVRIFYDADGSYSAGDEAGAANTTTRAILTWTNGGGPWSIDPAASTTWLLVTANCVAPTLNSGSGVFQFHFKPGKVATETTAPAKWHIFAIADDGTATANATDQNNNMNWLGEITVNTGSVNWGTLSPGTDFNGASNNQTGISVTYLSNGAYDEEIAASANWTGASTNATLDATGSCTNANEFSLKANDTYTLGSAILIKASPTYDVIDDTGTQTGESGDTVATNTLWLKLSSIFMPETYSGTIYYKIVDGT